MGTLVSLTGAQDSSAVLLKDAGCSRPRCSSRSSEMGRRAGAEACSAVLLTHAGCSRSSQQACWSAWQVLRPAAPCSGGGRRPRLQGPGSRLRGEVAGGGWHMQEAAEFVVEVVVEALGKCCPGARGAGVMEP